MRWTPEQLDEYQARRSEPVPSVKPKAKPLTASEHDEQVALIQRCNLNLHKYPELQLLFAIPNAGAGAQSGQAGKMKAEGTKSGVPDLFLPVSRRGCKGLFIEMKTSIGRVSDEQRFWIDALNAQDYYACVCRGSDEAWKCLLWYLGYLDSV
jgi:hypothetical protein